MWSPRETQILDLLLSGKHANDIAKALKISIKTVRSRLVLMYNKAGLPDNGRFKIIRLAAFEMYRRHPELIPFTDGDRALKVGDIPANVYVRVKFTAY